MKLVVFAHTPPPHHGQSYMVQLMLEGFQKKLESNAGSPTPLICHHVNARISETLENIGEYQVRKIFRLIGFALLAIWYRFRYGATNFYYIPAPGKHSAIYRDWLVMFLCRPFFKKIIFHWHATGLGKWLEQEATPFERWLSCKLLGKADLSIVLSKHNIEDAKTLNPREIIVVGNGINDPCPDFDNVLLEKRKDRVAARRHILNTAAKKNSTPKTFFLNVLFLAHCMEEKGLFDTLKGVLLANRTLTQIKSPFRVRLQVAGAFATEKERGEFDTILQLPEAKGAIEYLGFLFGEEKNKAFENADIFCFPTFYHAESFGLVIAEAMAFGLPIVATRWHSIPDVLPEGYTGLVDIKSPDQIADMILKLAVYDDFELLRHRFTGNFTLEKHLHNLFNTLTHLDCAKPKLLVLEFWGLGDLAIATPFLQAASQKYDVTVVAKPYALEMQSCFWPEVKVIAFTAPWTKFLHKYNLAKWDWRNLFQLLNKLRQEKFDIAVSGRWDPRDHLLLWLAGIKERWGFARTGSRIFLSASLSVPPETHHYKYWQVLATRLGITLSTSGGNEKPPVIRSVLIHSGAAQQVRVWPVERYHGIAKRLRNLGYIVHIACDASQKNWWEEQHENPVTPRHVIDLVTLLNNSDLFIGNDSGPGHIAAAANVPTFTIFGPQLPELFLPIHPQAGYVEGKPCPYKPCSDYCHYPAPHCILNISEAEVWLKLQLYLKRSNTPLESFPATN